MYRNPCDGHVGLTVHVGGQHIGIIHSVELIARKDEHVPDVGVLEGADVLPHSVGGTLVPPGIVQGLLGGQNLHKATAKRVECVGASDVAMQAHRVELRENVDALHAAVDAVRERHIDDSIFASKRYGRLRAIAGEWIKP